MAEKCSVCSNPIEVIFLEKINGTYLKDTKGKKRVVCSDCQKKLTLAEIRSKI